LKTVFLFPGQGSQIVGMGKDLAAQFDSARARFAEAADILGFDLAATCFEGPEDALKQTRITQPALYVHSCILTELLAQRGVKPDAAAGHSLGEYSALYAAGAFSFADGLRLVKARAEAMQKAGTTNPGTMAAVVGLDEDAVRDICYELESEGVVVPANYNSPGQLVISGEVNAVRKAVDMAKSQGAKLAKELPVSGAFHSPLMRPAAEALAQALAAAPLSQPAAIVVSNVTAKPHTDVESLRRSLAQQLLSPVRWTESMNELATLGEVRWFEVGSGSVLSGLLKRIVKGAAATGIGTAGDLSKLDQTASVQ
jgi:[acyl-carrier-protein] S-malonyltransferase